MRRPAVCPLAETLGMRDGEGEASNVLATHPAHCRLWNRLRGNPQRQIFFPCPENTGGEMTRVRSLCLAGEGDLGGSFESWVS